MDPSVSLVSTLNQRIGVYVPLVVNFLVNVRLGWGPAASRASSPSQYTKPTFASTNINTGANGLEPPKNVAVRPITPSVHGDKEWFTADIDDGLVKILPNDWPYSGMSYIAFIFT